MLYPFPHRKGLRIFVATLLLAIALPSFASVDSLEAYKRLALPDGKAKVDTLLKVIARYHSVVNVEPIMAEATRLTKRYSYAEVEPKLCNVYGVCMRDKSNYSEALKLHNQALALARKQGNTAEEINALNNIGVVYRRLDESTLALRFHLEALKLSEKVADDYNASIALNSIGNIHIVLGNYHDAIAYFKQCLPIAEHANNKLGIAMNLNNIGEAYEYLNILDSAKYYYNESLRYNESISCQKGIAICYNSLGNVMRKQGLYYSSIQLFQNALSISFEEGDRIYVANSYNNLGFAYLGIKKLSQAEKAFREGLAIALAIGSKAEAKNSYQGLMQQCEASHRYADALAFCKQYKVYADSIVNEKNGRNVAQMEAIYEREKEQQRIAFLEMQQRDNLLLAFGALGLVLLLFVSLFLIMLRRRLLEKNRHLQRELDIRYRIAADLHDDMGSTLSSISILSSILAQKLGGVSADLQGMAEKIQASAKSTLDAVDDIVWLVNPTNDRFCNLSLRIREYAIPLFESRGMRFSISFPDSLADTPISMENRRSIYFIVKEAVNNMVKYAQCTQASINVEQSNSLVTFCITDNGKGFDTDATTNRNGLRNMRARADKMKASLTILSEKGTGTKIMLAVALA